MNVLEKLDTRIPGFLKEKEEYRLVLDMIKKNKIKTGRELKKFINENIEEAQQSLKEEKQISATTGPSSIRRVVAERLDILNFVKNELLRYL